jgi:hypothetical protein
LDERAEVSETGGLSFVQMRYGISSHTKNKHTQTIKKKQKFAGIFWNELKGVFIAFD